ncbi:MAG: T9SS type A sorting domain-containing protein [Saprospiraceae bacterium]|nr:T9SS type A sorting domain-containing protein [Saprospiraceae bacterium]
MKEKFYVQSMRIMLLLCLPIFVLQVQAQNEQDVSQASKDFKKMELFEADWSSAKSRYQSEVKGGIILKFSPQKRTNFMKQKPMSFSIQIPSESRNENMTLLMTRSKIFDSNFNIFTSSNPNTPYEYVGGLHYHGTVENDPNSKVALSIFDDEVMGLIITKEGNYNLGRLKNEIEDHILYLEQDLINKPSFSCGMEDDLPEYTEEDLTYSARAAGDCIRVYMEVDRTVTINKGSVANAANYVIGAFNQNVLIYNGESINMAISEMFVWDTPDPYSGPSAGQYLTQFQANRGAFNGDLGHLVAMVNNGGIAAGFSGICNPDTDESLCYSGILDFFENVPVFSFTVMILAHEMGHLIGSRHTHACVWNGNNTAIDGCAGFVETDVAVCSLPGSPAGGGTIMSYCHNDPVGVNFALGFGLQPGNVIRNTVANAACLNSSCAGCDVAIGIVIVNNETCPNANNGGLTINATTSTGPLTYSITGPSNQSNATGVFTNLPDGVYNITVTDTGIADCTATSVATIAAGTDVIPPVPVCRTASVTLSASGNHTFTSGDVLNLGSSSDNCGTVNFVSASPAVVNCSHVGLGVPVTVTVNDGNGNTNTCVALIAVQEGTGLPAPWSGANIGNSQGTSIYKPCTSNGQFTLTAKGFSSGADLQHSVHAPLCGNGSITVRVTSLTNAGFAGVQFRENLNTGSRKVALKTQLNNFVHRVVRSTSNGMVVNQLFIAPNEQWLRITRTGNQFHLFSSTNGVLWLPKGAVTLVLPNCIQAGFFTESINASTTTTAIFDNVSTTGALPLEASTDAMVVKYGDDLEVYPNPSSGNLTVNLENYLNHRISIYVHDIQGNTVDKIDFGSVAAITENIDLQHLPVGMYLIRVVSDQMKDATKKIVIFR